MSKLFHDPSFWVLIAFIIFITVVVVKAWSSIITVLEGRSTLIKNKISESEKTLTDAKELLKESQNALKKYKSNSKELVSQEKQKALEKASSFIEKIEEDIKRKENLMDKEIEYLQNSVKISVQEKILEITINTLQNIISDPKNIQYSDLQFKKFLKKIPKTVSNTTLR
jgi:F-type H+-transporting ATPase subunit b